MRIVHIERYRERHVTGRRGQEGRTVRGGQHEPRPQNEAVANPMKERPVRSGRKRARRRGI